MGVGSDLKKHEVGICREGDREWLAHRAWYHQSFTEHRRATAAVRESFCLHAEHFLRYQQD